MAVDYTKNDTQAVVPVWTLSTEDGPTPDLTQDERMTSERLSELRSALAAFASMPIATLEAHPLPEVPDDSNGIPLDSASPLAQHLADLVAGSPTTVGSAAGTLYRMVVPEKVAAAFSGGAVGALKGAAGGTSGSLLPDIAAYSKFIPAAGKLGAMTFAPPLILMSIATGLSSFLGNRSDGTNEKLLELLKKLDKANLNNERGDMNACVPAIDKATAVLLDRGDVGLTLGLDSAVHAIDKGVSLADTRLKEWQRALSKVPVKDNGKVELAKLRDAIPAIDIPGSEFYAHLELADLAIALKRRVLVLQAVEHAQRDEGNPFENFMRALKSDQRKLDELAEGYSTFVQQLADMKLDRSHGVRDVAIMSRDVDKLIDTGMRLRELPDRMPTTQPRSDVAIEIAQKSDGSLVVFPAYAVR